MSSRTAKAQETQAGKEGESENTVLVGFVRLSQSGKSINLSIKPEVIAKLPVFEGKNGEKMVNSFITIKAIDELIDNKKEVTSISHFIQKED